jgi:hypothetical protein
MPVPAKPKLYHIVHVDRLASIIEDKQLWSDAQMIQRQGAGTTIGMSSIKERRLRLPVSCRPGLRVGECVPFYFCPRSIMLFLIHCANHPELTYKGGQGPIVHLELAMHEVITWAERQGRKWAFTTSNAGAYYFEDRCDLSQLDEINWDAVATHRWAGSGIPQSTKEGKQAEFLVENSVPWNLVQRIGVHSQGTAQQVAQAMNQATHRPRVEITRNWYY